MEEKRRTLIAFNIYNLISAKLSTLIALGLKPNDNGSKIAGSSWLIYLEAVCFLL